MLRINVRLLFPIAALAMGGCATSGHLNTHSGHPEIAVKNRDWKAASVAIAAYNLSKGREIDKTKPDRLVLYEAVPASDGKLQVTSKVVYGLTQRNDSLIISSQRFVTDDLDDETADEATDQPTLDAQQQELDEIARMLVEPVSANETRNQ
jgi:hypothetical protein